MKTKKYRYHSSIIKTILQMRKVYFLAFYCTIFAFWGCKNNSGGEFNQENRVIPAVEAVQAQYGGLPLEERLSGIVQARNQVDIYPRIDAPVEEVHVESGDQVSKGDLLVSLSDTEYRERLRQAEANLRINKAQERQARAALGELQSRMNRMRVLAERDLSSDLEVEQLEAELESAEANAELAQAQVEQAESTVAEAQDALSRTQIRAPIDGTVGQRSAEVGMQANSGTRLFTIGDLDDSRITINLTERMLGYIEKGQSVRIFSENLEDTTLTGEISRISPFLGAGNFSTEAEIDISNSGRLLLPGMFATVDVLYGESEQATLVPMSAIYRNPQTGETGIYVASGFELETEMIEEMENEGGTALSNPTDVEFVPVQIIARGREAAGVTGVRSGQWVVTVGQNLLMEDREGGTARVRAVTWDQVIDKQDLQPQDLLRTILNSEVVETPRMGSTSNQL